MTNTQNEGDVSFKGLLHPYIKAYLVTHKSYFCKKKAQFHFHCLRFALVSKNCANTLFNHITHGNPLLLCFKVLHSLIQ